MKKLYLIRHAKSSWDFETLPDRERPLAKRGHSQIRFLKKFIQKFEWRVDQVLVSPSKRTESTYKIIQKGNPSLPDPVYRQELYETDWKEILKLLQNEKEENQSIAVVGHNPGLENLARFLLTSSDNLSLFSKFPTSSFLGLHFSKNSWAELSAGTCQLEVFWIPGNLGKQ